MTDFEELRDDALAVHNSLTGMLAPRLAETRARLLAESRDKLNNEQFTVVVCGEFKRGKSSLLNALVDRPDLFPVDADIATSAVMTLRWGERESATVYFAEATPGDPQSAPPPQAIDPGRAAEFVTEQGNPGNAKNVLRIDMEAPIEQLASGIVLVDTPGAGSLNPAHTAATRAYLRYADAILFVLSAVEPAGTLELDLLRVALAQCPTVVTAVTMIDRVVSPGPVVDEARARIAKAAERDPAELVIVPVSAFRKRDALDDGDGALLTASGFPRLEAELWQGLTVTLGVAQVNTVLDAMYAALAEAAAPVVNDLTALQGDPGNAEAELREQRDMLQKLRSDSRGWRRGLQDDLDLAARPVQRQLDADLDAMYDEFRRALGTPDAVRDPDRVIQRASAALLAAGERANDDLALAFQQVADKYTAMTRFSLTVSGAAGGAAPYVSVQAPPKARAPKTVFTTVRQIWTGGLTAGGAGAFIGSLVAPGAGTLVGGAVGLVFGLFSARHDHKALAQERERREYVNKLEKAVLTGLESGRKQLVRAIADQTRDYSRMLTGALEDEITASADSLDASIRAMAETARRDAQSRADRQRALSRQLAELNTMRAELDRLRARANGMTRPRPAAGGTDSTSGESA